MPIPIIGLKDANLPEDEGLLSKPSMLKLQST